MFIVCMHSPHCLNTKLVCDLHRQGRLIRQYDLQYSVGVEIRIAAIIRSRDYSRKMAVKAYVLFFVSVVFLLGVSHSSRPQIKACPCSDPSLCKPVDIPPRPELVAFTIQSALQWKLYNYTYITTLAVFGNLTLDPQVRS